MAATHAQVGEAQPVHFRKVDVRLPGKGNLKLPWREAGPLNHHDNIVDSDQQVVNEELSLWRSSSTLGSANGRGTPGLRRR